MMLVNNLIEHSDNYRKTSGSLWRYCIDEPNNDITQSESSRFKSKFLDNANNPSIMNSKIGILLINCEINLILTWSAYCTISEGNRKTTFAITDTKLYVPVVTLSTQDNTKLLQQLKSGFRRTTNWNKYQSK